MGPTEWGLLIILSVLWGGSFFFGKVAVKELAPFTIVLCRVAIGAAVLALVVRTMGLKMPTNFADWTPYFIMGLINNVIPFSLIFWGQKDIGVGLASVLNAATPLSAAIVAHLLTTDEKLRSNRILRRAGAANVMLVTLLVPFTATALGIIFLDEAVHATGIAGAALVGLALLIIDARLFAAFRRTSQPTPAM